MLQLHLDFERKGRREHLEEWIFAQPELVEYIVEGPRKAGLVMARASGS